MTDTGNARAEVIKTLAATVTSLRLHHPTRVGIDGWSGSGKTTLADELAAAVRAAGRQTMRASFDNFHRKGHRYRSMRGEWTPRLYYDEGYDYAAFRAWLLEPVGPGGSRRCRPAMLDSFNDVLFPEEWHDLAEDAVVVVDGIFLLHPDLAVHWDYVIWLDVDVETMVARACQRAPPGLGRWRPSSSGIAGSANRSTSCTSGSTVRPTGLTLSWTTATSSGPGCYGCDPRLCGDQRPDHLPTSDRLLTSSCSGQSGGWAGRDPPKVP